MTAKLRPSPAGRFAWLSALRIYYIETRQSNNLMAALLCKMAIEESLDLHVDLVVNAHVKEMPIYKIVKKQGVQL